MYLHAGPEIGVASTKAFTSQLTVLSLLTLLLGRMRRISNAEGMTIAKALQQIPAQVAKILKQNDTIRVIAQAYKKNRNFLYLGRSYNFPVALEGALKLKEISYVHAEGYPAAEMKHGPIALIDKEMPSVVIALRDSVYEKVLSNIQEIKARGGRIIVIADPKGAAGLCLDQATLTLPEMAATVPPLVCQSRSSSWRTTPPAAWGPRLTSRATWRSR